MWVVSVKCLTQGHTDMFLLDVIEFLELSTSDLKQATFASP